MSPRPWDDPTGSVQQQWVNELPGRRKCLQPGNVSNCVGENEVGWGLSFIRQHCLKVSIRSMNESIECILASNLPTFVHSAYIYSQPNLVSVDVPWVLCFGTLACSETASSWGKQANAHIFWASDSNSKRNTGCANLDPHECSQSGKRTNISKDKLKIQGCSSSA